MINYIIPGLYEHFEFNKAFIKYLKIHPEKQIENTKINAVYGNFQFCIWDGGRVFPQYHQATIEQINNIFSYFTDEGIVSRLVFTNSQLTEQDYFDRYCNLVLTIGQDYNVEIVVADDNLREYIHSKYPSYQFISSTTKCITNFDKLKEEINNPNYKMVCLDYNLNHNKKILDFTPEEKEKTEFLCNAICKPGCPYRKEHYKLNSLFGLTYGQAYAMSDCSIKENSVSSVQKNSPNNISLKEIQDVYEPNGFKYFKLEGRTFNNLENLNNYANYFIKPEHYQEFIVDFDKFYCKV